MNSLLNFVIVNVIECELNELFVYVYKLYNLRKFYICYHNINVNILS